MTKREPSFVSIKDVEIVRETSRALLCRIEDREIWIPRSMVGEDSEINATGERGVLSIAEWLAEKENLLG